MGQNYQCRARVLGMSGIGHNSHECLVFQHGERVMRWPFALKLSHCAVNVVINEARPVIPWQAAPIQWSLLQRINSSSGLRQGPAPAVSAVQQPQAGLTAGLAKLLLVQHASSSAQLEICDRHALAGPQSSDSRIARFLRFLVGLAALVPSPSRHHGRMDRRRISAAGIRS